MSGHTRVCLASVQFTVSRWRRRKLVARMRDIQQGRPDIQLRWGEDRRWLSSDFHVTVEGDDSDGIVSLMTSFTRWALLQEGMGPMRSRRGGYKATRGYRP